MSEFRAPREPLVALGKIDHHIADMTVAVAADVPLRQVQETLGASSQWLPIDGDPELSVGQLIETNSTGPLRLGYGAWRDLLLGAQFTNGRVTDGEGELITAGGRAVKNVAGYDLTKFMVGQGGVFAKLVAVTTRTYKTPTGAILASFAPNPSLIQRLLPSPARPQWALLTSTAMLCGYLGDDRALAYYSELLREWKPRSIDPRSLEEDIEHRAGLWRGEFRASVPPAKLREFVAAANPTTWVADAVFGIVLGTGDESLIQRAATTLNGTVSFSRSGGAAVGFTVSSASQRALLERLKTSFDPDNKLAPLPWQRS
jgi:hypothetical protein